MFMYSITRMHCRIIEGAKDGKGRGRQVIAGMLVMVMVMVLNRHAYNANDSNILFQVAHINMPFYMQLPERAI